MPSDRSRNSGIGAGGPSGPEPGPGAYMPPDHKATTIRGSFMRMEGSGVQYGLNSYSEFDSEALSFPRYDGARDPLTGNAAERPDPYRDGAISASGKGHSFTIC